MNTYMYGNFEDEQQEPTNNLVLVETIETFRVRYVIPVPKGKEDWALDTVAMDEGTQFSQKFLDETVVSYRIISDEEALALSDEDNDYAREWPDKQKRAAFYSNPIQENGVCDYNYFIGKNI